MTDSRPRRRRRDLVDVERRGVDGQDRAGLGDLVDFGEDLLLQRHVFEDSFDDDVGLFEPVVSRAAAVISAIRWSISLLRKAALLDGVLVVLADRGHAAIERLLRRLFNITGMPALA